MKEITVRFADNTAQGQVNRGVIAGLDTEEGTLVVVTEDGYRITYNWDNVVYVGEKDVDEATVAPQAKGQASGFFS